MRNIKARIVRTDARVIGDRAISADRIDNVQGRVSIARLQKGKRLTGRVDMIGALRVRRIDIGKIDIQLSSGRYRRSRSNFCRALLLLRMSSRKSNPAQSPTRSLRSRGSFWKKRPATMFN